MNISSLNWRNILITYSPWRYVFPIPPLKLVQNCTLLVDAGACPKKFSPKRLQCLRALGKPEFGGEMLSLLSSLKDFVFLPWHYFGAAWSWAFLAGSAHMVRLPYLPLSTIPTEALQPIPSTSSPLSSSRCHRAEAALTVWLQEPPSMGTCASSQPAGDSSLPWNKPAGNQ